MSTLAASAYCSMNTRRGSTLMWREPLTGNMGEDLSLTNLVAEPALAKARGHLLCRRVTDSVTNINDLRIR
jgi:hypothetical protein